MKPDELEALAIAIYAAMYRQYPNYQFSGPTPEKAWANLSEEQRRMSRDQARAAVEHLATSGWRRS